MFGRGPEVGQGHVPEGLQIRAQRGEAGRVDLVETTGAVGLVANRLKPWTTASQQAIEEMKKLPFPLVGQLRDTQGYVLVASLGKGIYDYNSEIIRTHQDDWEKILRWLKRQHA